MTSKRFVIGTVLSISALTLAVACSSSTTGSATSAATSGPSGTSFDKCGGTSTSQCTAEELKPYSECFVTACDSKFGECYGPDWKAGTYSGPCGTYLTCFNACACNDEACYAACPEPSAECSACRIKSSACSDGCKLPACGGGATSGEPACADLAACCARMENANLRNNCNETRATVGTDFTLCKPLYDTFKPQCP